MKNTYFIYDKNENLVGKIESGSLADVQEYLYNQYGDDALNMSIEQDNVSWSDAELLASL